MSKQKKIFSFAEARRMVRAYGFENHQEFEEYECAGSYKIAKNANEIYEADWTSWEDFLGIPLSFEDGRKVARELKFTSQGDYMDFIGSKRMDDSDPSSRLPYRPDLYYKASWKGWSDWLGLND